MVSLVERWQHFPLLLLLFPVVQCTLQPEPLDWASLDALIAEEFPDVPSVTTADLAAAIRNGEQPVVLLDVREPQEFAVSHLKGAHRVDSPADATSLIAESAANGLIVAYCSVGYRSAAMVEALRRRGIENAVNLQGSIFAWANEGRPVYRDGSPVEEVHPFDAAWGELLNTDLRSPVAP